MSDQDDPAQNAKVVNMPMPAPADSFEGGCLATLRQRLKELREAGLAEPAPPMRLLPFPAPKESEEQ